MIKANELRRGNWIVGAFGALHRVEDIAGDTLPLSYTEAPYQLEDVYPIPLTPEILEKAGFAHRQESFFHYYSKKYTHVAVETVFELEYLDEETYAWIEGNTIVHLSYLHQLQNLYFALTGEELEVTL